MKITGLYVYPIKGIRGIKLDTAQIGPQGISHDRRFMLWEVKPTGQLGKVQVDSHPKCALFEQQIVSGSRDGESLITVRYLGNEETKADDEFLRLPLEPDFSSLEKTTVNLHTSPTAAYRMGDACDAWFSQRFGVPVILVYLGDGRRGIVGKTLLPKSAREQQQQPQRGWMASLTSYVTGSCTPDKNSEPWITFADVAALLVTSEASLRDVQERLLGGLPVPMYKFRPNIVVDGEGEDSWAEDLWAELTISHDGGQEEGSQQHKLEVMGNCVRCVSLNVDYETGKPAEGEMGNVLKRLMKDRRVDTGSKWSPVFGRYAVPIGESFTASVGDEVEVTRRNTERTVWDWNGL
ncbi:hypothetical protein N0V88_007637 [Collariella sp. IMI 366227]|nr:hypothetical protein N0V88_007637 [Collariella sp. IMI 366227]